MIEFSARCRRRASEQRRSTLPPPHSDLRHSSESEGKETGLEQPAGPSFVEKCAVDEAVVPLEDPVTAISLSDEALESVAGGLGVPADAPSNLRKATCCYLADATSEEAFASVT